MQCKQQRAENIMFAKIKKIGKLIIKLGCIDDLIFVSNDKVLLKSNIKVFIESSKKTGKPLDWRLKVHLLV